MGVTSGPGLTPASPTESPRRPRGGAPTPPKLSTKSSGLAPPPRPCHHPRAELPALISFLSSNPTWRALGSSRRHRRACCLSIQASVARAEAGLQHKGAVRGRRCRRAPPGQVRAPESP